MTRADVEALATWLEQFITVVAMSSGARQRCSEIVAVLRSPAPAGSRYIYQLPDIDALKAHLRGKAEMSYGFGLAVSLGEIEHIIDSWAQTIGVEARMPRDGATCTGDCGRDVDEAGKQIHYPPCPLAAQTVGTPAQVPTLREKEIRDKIGRHEKYKSCTVTLEIDEARHLLALLDAARERPPCDCDAAIRAGVAAERERIKTALLPGLVNLAKNNNGGWDDLTVGQIQDLIERICAPQGGET